LNLSSIRTALAANLTASIPAATAQVNTEPLATPTAPCLEIDLDPQGINYHQAMQNGLTELYMIVRGLWGLTTDVGASRNRDTWLTSDLVKTAIESDRTLGGAAKDLIVTGVTPRTMVSAASPNTAFLALEWSVLIYPA